MPYDWGARYIVPSKALSSYGGRVLLRQSFDKELLRKHLDERGFAGRIVRVTNFWFYRKKSSKNWIRIGDSHDIPGDFSASWDTTCLENGQYEIIGFMQAFVTNSNLAKWEEVTLGNGEYEKFGWKPIFVKKRLEKRVIAEQRIVEVNIQN